MTFSLLKVMALAMACIFSTANAATAVASTSLDSTLKKAGCRPGDFTFGFTSSATALVATNTITITLGAGNVFGAVDSARTVGATTGITGCTDAVPVTAATSGSAGLVLTITLGTGCAVAGTTAVTIKILGLPVSPSAQTITSSIVTTQDATAETTATYVIGAAGECTGWTSATVLGTSATAIPGSITFSGTTKNALAATETITLTASSAIFAADHANDATTTMVTATGTTGTGCDGYGAISSKAGGGAAVSGTQKVLTVTLPTGCSIALNTGFTLIVTTNLAANPAASTAVTFSISTTSDTEVQSQLTGYTTTAATAPASVTFTPHALSTLTSPLKLSVVVTGAATVSAQSTGGTVTVKFGAAVFAAAGATTVTVTSGGGATGCSATGSVDGTKMILTITLTDTVAATACAQTANTATTFVVHDNLADHGAAGIVQGQVKTSSDTTYTTIATAYTIAAAAAPTAVAGVFSPDTAEASSVGLFKVTTSANNGLAHGSTVKWIASAAMFAADGPVAVQCDSNCLCTAVVSNTKMTLTVTLKDTTPHSCSVAGGATLIAAVACVNPAAASITQIVETSSDKTPAASGALVTIAAVDTATIVSVVPTSYTGAGAPGDVTVTLKLSSAGALSSANTITLTFGAAYFTASAPTPVTLASVTGLTGSGCTPTASSTAAAVVVVTLASPCTALASADISFKMTDNLVVNPASGTTVTATVTTTADATGVSQNLYKVGTTTTFTSATPNSAVAGGVVEPLAIVFAASASGVLAAGNKITIESDQFIFADVGGVAVTLAGVTACTDTPTHTAVAETPSKLVITLGTACVVANSAAVTVTITDNLAQQFAVGTVTKFRVSTTGDAATATFATGYTSVTPAPTTAPTGAPTVTGASSSPTAAPTTIVFSAATPTATLTPIFALMAALLAFFQ